MDHLQRSLSTGTGPKQLAGGNRSDRSPQRREAIPLEAMRLRPVISRAIDLGRGPPALMEWLRERLPELTTPQVESSTMHRNSMLDRLAIEAAQTLNRLPVRAAETVWNRQSAWPGISETLVAANAPVDRPTIVDSARPAHAANSYDCGATILLAEEEPAVRNLLRYILKRNGHTVIEAANGTEALALADTHAGTIDLLITDLSALHMGGERLAQVLCARRPGLKVLFLCGCPDEAIARQEKFRVESDFLQKPFSPLALVRMVRELLDR